MSVARVTVFLVLLGLLPLPGRAAPAPPTLDEVLAQPTVAGIKLLAPHLIAKLYQRPEAQPLWRPAALASLERAITSAADDGLRPEDFLATALHAPGLDAASREVLATEAFIRLAYALHFGQINPRIIDPDINYARRLSGLDPVAFVRQSIRSGDIPATLATLRPQGRYYPGLRAALARYREFAMHGAWPQVPAGPTLKPGMSDDRVPVLRQRLLREDLLEPAAAQGRLYDSPLQEAVRRFQRQQGLTTDGALGAGTLAALNVPVSARVQQLRVNLERLRWVFRDFPAEFVAVNIAGFRAGYVKDGKVLWSGRAIVGKPFRQTPIFKAEITTVEFNPDWTVPPTILKQDFLPKLRRSRRLLKEKSLQVIDASGQTVDPESVDWTHFRYQLRQPPGPDNALGRVKFLFPNPHSVYLHDTPARELFAQRERTFSSGCIRIEQPLALAPLLLNNPVRWDQPHIDEVLARGRTQRVALPHRVPIFLLYLTAFVDDDGALAFRRDVYRRDAAVQKALDAPLALSPPEDYPVR